MEAKDNVIPEIDINYIIKSGPGYIYWKNLDSVYLGCNKNYATLIGLNDSAEVHGMGEYDMPWGNILPETAEHNIKADRKVIETGTVVITEEDLGLKNADGNSIVLRSEKLPLLDKNGNIVGVLGVSVDITDRLEKEKLRAQNDAQKIENERQQAEIEKKHNENIIAEQERFRKIVSQVAHDMGSPVAAISMVLPSCSTLPESVRDILRVASTRIRDIANNLFYHYNKVSQNLDNIDVIEPTLISCQILEIVAEKKYEYKYKNIVFEYQFGPGCVFSCVNANASGFKRMISNIINNSVDAVKNTQGKINIILNLINDLKELQIIVEDNGSGIPDDVKQKIIEGIQITSGKIDGKGIGFGQIRDVLDACKGKFLIDSQMGVGTKIVLNFPVTKSPDWLISELTFNEDNLIVILDDDSSIHGAWDNWFKAINSEIRIKHFIQGIDTIDFINSLSKEEKNKVLLLADYELLNQRVTGLDVIYNVSVGQAVLTTSHYANAEILDQACERGIKILPKLLVQLL